MDNKIILITLFVLVIILYITSSTENFGCITGYNPGFTYYKKANQQPAINVTNKHEYESLMYNTRLPELTRQKYLYNDSCNYYNAIKGNENTLCQNRARDKLDSLYASAYPKSGNPLPNHGGPYENPSMNNHANIKELPQYNQMYNNNTRTRQVYGYDEDMITKENVYNANATYNNVAY